jgi:molecular chaperone HscB
MLAIELESDFFALFGLQKTFQLDQDTLDKAYLALQAQYHPDRAAHLTDTDKHHYLQAATYINMAYQTLKYPLSRARYLLQLAGIETHEETNTAMPTDFLMAQMQWREEIQQAHASKTIEALEKLHQALHSEIDALNEILMIVLDQQQDLPQAALVVRKYRFYEKLDEEIGDAIESILF